MAILEATAAHSSQIRNVTLESILVTRLRGEPRAQQIEMWRTSEILVGQALDLVLASKCRQDQLNLAALQEIENQMRAFETDSLLNLGRNIWPLPAASIG